MLYCFDGISLLRYLEVLLRRVSASQILYSPHLSSFVNNNAAEPTVGFNAEEYTDFNGKKKLEEDVLRLFSLQKSTGRPVKRTKFILSQPIGEVGGFAKFFCNGPIIYGNPQHFS